MLHCDEMWVVNFYSAWAKLCMKFFPVFQKAAAELKGRGVKFGGYDLSADSQFQEKYNVSLRLPVYRWQYLPLPLSLSLSLYASSSMSLSIG